MHLNEAPRSLMTLLNRVFGRWSHRQQALALYERAMAFAKNRDHDAALADYTAVIEMNSVPADIRAMALYNRSVVYSAIHDDAQAIRDLQQVLETPGAAANVRLEAKRKLVRIERASTRSDENQSPRPS
jgi:tetratricopeptide (TPR) repeat protein